MIFLKKKPFSNWANPQLTLARLALSLCTAFFMVSCANETDSSPSPAREGQLGPTVFLLGPEPELTLTDSLLKGSGSVTALAPLGEIKSNRSIQVNFQLENEGTLEVSAYSNKTNEDGIAMIFMRNDDALIVKLEAEGKSIDVSENFAALDAGSEISVLLDVHNFETPAHILAWKGDVSEPDDSNALFNSEKASDGESPGNGTGTFWGLTLNKASVTLADAAEAKFKHGN